VRQLVCDGARLAFCGGLALHLLSHGGFRFRMTGGSRLREDRRRLRVPGPVASAASLPASGLAGAITVVLGPLAAL
jgi:hypothetical protein